MIDEIDFFDRRANFQKKEKKGDDWNELKELKLKQTKPANKKGSQKSESPPADKPES